MSRILKLQNGDTEVNLDALTSVSSAKLVRVYNGNAAATVITQTNAAEDETYGTLRLAIGEVVFIEKAPTDKLKDSTTDGDVYATAIAFTD